MRRSPSQLTADAFRALQIPASRNSFTVEFSALDYSAPELSRYAYQLVGFDRDWIQTDASRRLAAYSNLPPGDYPLLLRAARHDGAWTEISLPLQVTAAWYQTPMFRVFAALAGLMALALLVQMLVQLRTVLLRQRQHELELEVQQRTAELRDSQRRLEQIAYFDTLTGLPNRRRFSDRFRSLLSRQGLQGFALLLIDLDHFRQINDTLGHDAGDALLAEAARRLCAAVPQPDNVARPGGDEFAALMTVASSRDAEEICARIIASFVVPMTLGGTKVPAAVSIGMAVFPTERCSRPMDTARKPCTTRLILRCTPPSALDAAPGADIVRRTTGTPTPRRHLATACVQRAARMPRSGRS